MGDASPKAVECPNGTDSLSISCRSGTIEDMANGDDSFDGSGCGVGGADSMVDAQGDHRMLMMVDVDEGLSMAVG